MSQSQSQSRNTNELQMWHVHGQRLQKGRPCSGCLAVAFNIYDLKDTGVIERDEVKRLLGALLQENPAIDLNEAEIDDIVNQARTLLVH